ncbi:protein of unknown function [Methylocaldum szegediense]|uniref:Uncharacterized protein n=1 Tax=Methylocaldum szegediense TaxID=73780 RepID=A0ABM9HXS8_9GAMM|nr:protein of unknown function [Methylocaldum szegediense]
MRGGQGMECFFMSSEVRAASGLAYGERAPYIPFDDSPPYTKLGAAVQLMLA